MHKPRILLLTPHYLPGFKAGGPLRSIENLVNSLHDEFDFFILTGDRDLGDKVAYDAIPPDTWQKVGNAYVRYLNPTEQNFFFILNTINETDYDLLYLNSFFARWSSVYPLIGRRLALLKNKNVLLAPRGEFSPGAISQKKFRKKIYLFIFRILGIQRSITWQGSTLLESNDIIREVGCSKGRVIVASDLPAATNKWLDEGYRDNDTILHIVFLSRICRMKNLDYALDCLLPVRDPVVFNIFGPIEDRDYWALCQRKIRNFPPNVKVVYHGPVEPPMVKKVMRNNDVLFLPSLGENYGHVIPEALSVGTRVLVSDRTPWRNLQAQNLGADIDLSNGEEFTKAIREFANEGSGERFRRRVIAHAEFFKNFCDNLDLDANRRLFNELIFSNDDTSNKGL